MPFITPLPALPPQAATASPGVSGTLIAEVGRAGFNVSRAFVTVATPGDQVVRARLTLDAGRQAGNQGALSPVLRFGYVEGDTPAGTWRAGLIPTPWLAYDAQLWRHRIQGPLLAARKGWIAPADFGAALSGRMGPVSFDAGVFNGEGFLKPEQGGSASPQLRAVYHLAEKWELAGFAQRAAAQGDAEVLSLARRDKLGVFALQALHNQASGWTGTAYGWWTFSGDERQGLDLVGRIDRTSDASLRTIGGIGYRHSRHLRFLVDLEQEQGQPLLLAHMAYAF